MRVGLGYDSHRLEEGRKFIVGGVEIPFEKGLMGHSDADVLSHAITDALLGAAALGNIGQHFPDTDPAYKDADSLQILRKCLRMVGNEGYRIGNLDATIIAQAPKLNPYIDRIRASLAECLEVRADAVSVKAKTGEGVGPEGRGESVSVHAIVLLETAP